MFRCRRKFEIDNLNVEFITCFKNTSVFNLIDSEFPMFCSLNIIHQFLVTLTYFPSHVINTFQLFSKL